MQSAKGNRVEQSASNPKAIARKAFRLRAFKLFLSGRGRGEGAGAEGERRIVTRG